jgi:putative GTP pyrophosphokinase
MAVSNKILTEYGEKYDLYASYTESIRDVLVNIMKSNGIDILPPESRTKDYDSLVGKILRPEKDGRYTRLSSVTDLSGVRLIAYVKDDCDKICSIIRKNFKVDESNSIDKGTEFDDGQFGYSSRHLVVSYKSDRTRLPEFNLFKGLKAEVQVRTLLQHTWAAIDWKLRYKSKDEAPREVRRKLFRISALLETADDEFSYVTNGIGELKEVYRKLIKAGDLDLDIDAEALYIFFEEESKSGGILHVPISELKDTKVNLYTTIGDGDTGISRLIRTCDILGISKLSELKAWTEVGVSDMCAELKNVYADKGVRTTLSGLVRVCVLLACKRSQRRSVLKSVPLGADLDEALIAARELGRA